MLLVVLLDLACHCSIISFNFKSRLEKKRERQHHPQGGAGRQRHQKKEEAQQPMNIVFVNPER